MKVNREKSTGWGIFVFPSLLGQRRRVEAQNLCCFETLFLPPHPPLFFFPSLFSATKAARAAALDQSRGWSL